jgi:hypothetical protein
MRVLFVSRHCGYFRNYDSALRELAARGHEVHLGVEKHESLGSEAAVRALVEECPGISYGMVPEGRIDIWSTVAQRLRLGIDYLRYLDPFYDTAPLRRVRARERTPRLLTALAAPPLVGGARWRRAYRHLLHRIDSAVPPPAAIVDYLRGERPDVLLITPFVELGSPQVDYLRAARTLRIPCGLAIWSWDHLTTKAYIRDRPERVFVWNETQRREAVEEHGIPAGRVAVTGAQCFDHWFGRQPSRTRAEFCAELGLPDDRPIVLYVCSGLIKGSPSEPELVKQWLQWLRATEDPVVASAAVLVRPYPSRLNVWGKMDLSALGPVAVWGGNPFEERSRKDYFDSLYHSAAVVGLNTTAFLDAAIVGREVLTVLVPRFHDNQEGTAHFRHLLQIGGGLLRVARDPDAHVAQLGQALRRPVTSEHPHRAFLEAFIRPHGLDRPSSPELVAAIEELATCRVDEAGVEARAAGRRSTFERVVWLTSRLFADSRSEWSRKVEGMERWRRFRAEKEHATAARRAERQRAQAARLAEKQRVREAGLRDKQQAKAARVREKEQVRRAEQRRRATLKRRAHLKSLIREKLGLAQH